ncbi:MAG: LEA type 2 family protein [Chitinophagales bacterium]
MKRYLKIFFAALAILILTIAIAIIVNPKYWLKIINPIQYDIRTVDTKITQQEILLDFEVLLSSSYFLDLTIDSVAYQIYFDSTQFSHGSKSIGRLFDDKKVDTIHLPLIMERDALKGKMSSLEKGDSTNLIINFKNFLDLPVAGKTTFNVKVDKRIAAPQIPEIEVLSVNKVELSLKDAIYSIDFSIHNPNSYEIQIKNIDADIVFLDLFSGRASTIEPVEVKPKSSSEFTATINIDNLELVRDGLRVAFRPNKMWPYTIDVTMIIEQKDGTPMNVNLSHKSEMELMGRRKDNQKE